MRVSGNGWKSQSYSSTMAAPPFKKRYTCGFWLVVVPGAAVVMLGIILIGGGQYSLTATLEVFAFLSPGLVLPALVGVVLLAQATRYNRRTWPKLMEVWQQQFQCFRCGELFALAPQRDVRQVFSPDNQGSAYR